MLVTRTSRRSVIPLALLLAAGCGAPPPGSVSGRVTLDGTPVGGGFISFISPSGVVVTARIDADGTYTAAGVTPGEVV
ncbi:MAG TPA: hypothetical protein VGF55_11105, partial [Gemmataceae bacterium]